jgi:hypothetical protein
MISDRLHYINVRRVSPNLIAPRGTFIDARTTYVMIQEGLNLGCHRYGKFVSLWTSPKYHANSLPPRRRSLIAAWLSQVR